VNWIDILLLLVIVFSVLSGLTAGFARVGVGFIATLLGIFFGFWCYGIVAAYVLDYVSSRAVANLIGFFTIFVIISLLGAIVGRILAKFFKWVGLSWFDRLLGGAFGVVRGVIIAVALVTVLMAFAPSPPPRSVTDSAIYRQCVGFLRRRDAARNEGGFPRCKGEGREGLVGASAARIGEIA
jgi:membrane protein required for colicin V production